MFEPLNLWFQGFNIYLDSQLENFEFKEVEIIRPKKPNQKALMSILWYILYIRLDRAKSIVLEYILRVIVLMGHKENK